MNKVFGSVLSILVFCSFAHAAQSRVAGSWNGQAEYTNTWGSEAAPTTLALSFQEGEGSLGFSLQFTYPDGQEVQQALQFQVNGTELMYNGKTVGEVTADHLTMTDTLLGADTYSATFQKNADGTGTYSDKYCYGQKRDGDCESLNGTLDAQTARLLFSKIAAKANR